MIVLGGEKGRRGRGRDDGGEGQYLGSNVILRERRDVTVAGVEASLLLFSRSQAHFASSDRRLLSFLVYTFHPG